MWWPETSKAMNLQGASLTPAPVWASMTSHVADEEAEKGRDWRGSYSGQSRKQRPALKRGTLPATLLGRIDASLPLFSCDDLVQLLGQLPEVLDSCPHRLEVTVGFTEQKEKPWAPVTRWKPVAGASFLPLPPPCHQPALQPGVSGGWSSPQEVTSEQLGAAGREQMDQGSWGQGQG